MIYNAIIVDDELFAQKNLEMILSRHFEDIHIVGKASCIKDAKALIDALKPQIVFLDIHLNKEIGLDLLELIDTSQTQVIVVTAYDNYAMKALQLSAIDYVMKPIDKSDLERAINKAIENLKSIQNNEIIDNAQLSVFKEAISAPEKIKKLAVRMQGKIIIIELDKIIYFEGDSNYTKIILSNKDVLMSAKTLGEYDRLLQGTHFVRTHKSYLANLNYIKEINLQDGGYLTLSNGDAINVSRRSMSNLIEKLNEFTFFTDKNH
ncbi:MAG: response regulator transcription factor [Candidatus Competibacteraceae bacterium]|nr:response regulator transcription factor [Candidatus Competibacteraceae bacterium]